MANIPPFPTIILKRATAQEKVYHKAAANIKGSVKYREYGKRGIRTREKIWHEKITPP
jgi:hypothetical protein